MSVWWLVLLGRITFTLDQPPFFILRNISKPFYHWTRLFREKNIRDSQVIAGQWIFGIYKQNFWFLVPAILYQLKLRFRWEVKYTLRKPVGNEWIMQQILKERFFGSMVVSVFNSLADAVTLRWSWKTICMANEYVYLSVRKQRV